VAGWLWVTCAKCLPLSLPTLSITPGCLDRFLPPHTHAHSQNLGGPGWFKDVFDVKVHLNTTRCTLPSDSQGASIEVTELCAALGAPTNTS
jgi:hypothetical protein